MILAVIAARPLLGELDQAFQYIQEFTGFFTPGIVVLFLLGMFWKHTTALGALSAAIGSAVISIGFKLGLPSLPFIDRVGLVFIACTVLAVLISKLVPARAEEQDRSINLSGINFSTDRNYNLATIAVVIIVAALYITWW